MTRPVLFVLLVVGVGASAQAPPAGPKIDLNASADGAGGGSGHGSATASGKITLPAPWELSVHVLTVRYQKEGTTKTFNLLLPTQGGEFSTTLDLKSGTYKVWAVIDVKDDRGREKQISSDKQSVQIP